MRRHTVAVTTLLLALAGCGSSSSSSSAAGTLAFDDGGNQPDSAYEQPMSQLAKRCTQTPDEIGATVMATRKELKQAGDDETNLAVLQGMVKVVNASSGGKADCDQVAQTLVSGVKGGG